MCRTTSITTFSVLFGQLAILILIHLPDPVILACLLACFYIHL